ncbi:MAG: lysylphosphatidylglycerol synthase transmembrane domain-containing protein [Thermoanaerobaculum sp.]
MALPYHATQGWKTHAPGSSENPVARVVLSVMRLAVSTKTFQVAASLAAAAALLWFFFRRVSLHEVGAALKTLRLWPVAGAVGLALASYAARAWRWGMLLEGAGKPRFRTLAGCTAAGFATSTVLPARLGELVRPLLLSARTGLPAAATLASIVAERLLDLLTVVFLFAVALLTGSRGQAMLLRSLAVAAAAVVVLGVALLVVVKSRERVLASLSSRARRPWSQRVLSFVQQLLSSLAFWGSPRHAFELAWASLLTWGLAIAQVAVTAPAFGLALSPREATLVLAVSVVGLAVPTPGGVGGFHAATQLALVHIPQWPLTTATAFALVHHAVCFVPVTLIGFGYMLVAGFSFRRLPVEKP